MPISKSRKKQGTSQEWEEYDLPNPGKGYIVEVIATYYVREYYYEHNRERSEYEEVGRPETTVHTIADDLFKVVEELEVYRWVEGDSEYLTTEIEGLAYARGQSQYVKHEAEVSRVDGQVLTPDELEFIYEGANLSFPRKASYKEGNLNLSPVMKDVANQWMDWLRQDADWATLSALEELLDVYLELLEADFDRGEVGEYLRDESAYHDILELYEDAGMNTDRVLAYDIVSIFEKATGHRARPGQPW